MEAAQDAYNRGANITASRFYERAAELSAEPERRVRALLGCDEALYSDKRHDKQMEVMERAEAIIETEEVEKLLQAEVRNQYGRALRLTREGELAERQFLKGLDLFAANENYSVKARLLMGLGSNETDNKRDFKKAYEHNMEAVEVSRNAGDKKTQLMALSNIVHIGLHTGEYSLSIEKSREALSVYDDKDPRVLRNKLILDNNFGSAFMNIGDYEEAIRIFRESIEISTKRAGGFYIDYLLPNLARALSLASSDEALARLDEAIATHSDHPDEFMAGVAHLYTALAYTERRDWERAAPEAEEALRVALVHQDEKLEAMAQMAVAQVFHGEGKNEEALKRNERAYELLEKFGMQIEEFDLEIMLTQAQILMDLDRMTEAWTVIDAARQILHERATKITDTTQSDSFLKNVRVNREIEKYWNLLRSVSTEGRDAHLARLIAGLNLRVPAELPPALAMIGPSRAHEVSAPVQLNGDTGSGTLLNIPIVDALKTLLSRKVTVPKNIGPIDQVWAEEIEWTPFFDEEGNPNASVEFKLKTSPGHQWVFRLIGQIAGFPNEYRIRLQGKVKEEGGIVSIEMNVQEDQMLTEQQFGRITFVLAPTPDGKTLLALKLRNRLFTSNPDVILPAFVEGLAG